MIFYFSGTGNSLYVAKRIAEHMGEELINIASVVNSKEANYEYKVEQNEVIGFVYPTYAWNAPKIVLDFIEKLKLSGNQHPYIFSVTTMGENTGDMKKLIGKPLERKGLKLNSGFSVVMPNNYIIMGDVYTKKKEENLLKSAEIAIDRMIELIEAKEDDVYEIHKAFLSNVLTKIISPMFEKNGINTKKFFANDNCVSCGLCEQVCNCQNIKVLKKPNWGDKCTQCLACIHLCPVKAIQYKKGTESKGRYKNPNISVNEMKLNL